MRRPAISDTNGAKAKVICMVASCFREDEASIYWYLTPCERTVLVRSHGCTRDTIAQASRVVCDILTACIGIVRKACVVPSDKVCMDRFASVVGQAPDIVQGFSGVGPRERLARQEITLLEGVLRFTGLHAVTGRSSQPGKTNRIASHACPHSTGPCASIAPAPSTAAWRSGAMTSH